MSRSLKNGVLGRPGLRPAPSAPEGEELLLPADAPVNAVPCQDGLWAVLFLVHLVAFVGASVYVLGSFISEIKEAAAQSNGGSGSGNSTTNGTTTGGDDNDVRLNAPIMLTMAAAVGISSLIALMWLAIVRSYAKTMIYIALWGAVAMDGLAAIIFLITAQIIGAIVFFLFMLLKVVFIMCVRSRIALAAKMIEIAANCVALWPATLAFTFIGCVMQAVWMTLWSFGAILIYFAATVVTVNGKIEQQTNGLTYVIIFLLFLSFYWTSMVIKNVVHVTTAGVMGTWYFQYPQATPANPTVGAFKRAMTTSFGSICFGSFVLAFVRALRATVNVARNAPENRNGRGAAAILRQVALCIAECLLSILDRVIEYVNQYAFAQVALYGKSYMQAAKDAIDLLRARGFDAIINDSLVGTALTFAAYMSGVTAAVVCALLGHIAFDNSITTITGGVLGFVLGFAMTMVAVETIESAVIAFFVCLAEDPATLSRTKPEVYNDLIPALQAAYSRANFAVM